MVHNKFVKRVGVKRLKLTGDIEDIPIKDNFKKILKEPTKENFYKVLSLGTQLGFTVSVPIVGSILLGDYLDKKFKTTPKLTLSLLFLGFFLGIVGLYQIVQENTKKDNLK